MNNEENTKTAAEVRDEGIEPSADITDMEKGAVTEAEGCSDVGIGGDNDTDDGGEIDRSEDPKDKKESNKGESIDYAALMASDVAELKAEFPELRGISDVTDLNNPLRYAALRDLGLSPTEAYLATAKRVTKDTRSHLRAAYGRNAAASEVTMSPFELATARELFPGKNDAELQRLYKRVAR